MAAGIWGALRWSLRGQRILPPAWRRVGQECAEGKAVISNEPCRSGSTDWTPERIMRKVKEDKENKKHELASYGCVNPFLVIHEIVGQILKETLIKGTEKKWDKVQHRFTKGSLCQTVLTSSFDKIIGFPDKGNLVDLIYLQFNKAFDMVPHGKLLVKLEKMRINGRTQSRVQGLAWGQPWGWCGTAGGHLKVPSWHQPW